MNAEPLAVRYCDSYSPVTGRCTHSDPAPAVCAHGAIDALPFPRITYRPDRAGRIISRVRLALSRTYRYDALERTNRHSSLTYLDTSDVPAPLAGWWSPLYSRPLPADVDALPPGSDERRHACHVRRRIIAAATAEAIHAAYPELEAPHRCAVDDLTVSACEWTAPL